MREKKMTAMRGAWPFSILAGVAIVIGVIVRFKGLGTWPLAVDEYYLAQSIENVLRFGVPAYECGGFYTRGLAIQYAAAGLRLAEFSPELAPRVIAAISSLAVLPAAYLLGRRAHSRAVGLLVVALLAISVWEVEIGRFGRMYAPFQAVFTWYLVFFFRYTLDREKRALWGMVALTIVGAFVWEGAAIMAVANFLPPFFNHDRGRLSAAQWRYLGAMILLLPLAYFMATNDLRYAGQIPPLPPDFFEVTEAASPEVAAGPEWLLSTLGSHPLWLVLGVLPVAVALWAVPWILRFRQRWLATAGLLTALVAALAHQLLVVSSVLALLLLFRLVTWRELLDRRAAPFFVSVLVASAFWVAFALATDLWQGDVSWSAIDTLVGLGYQFFGFPDFLEVVARPWGRAVPVLGLSLLLFSVAAGVREILYPESAQTPATVLLAIALVMLLLVGASDPPQTTTRYIFFLYPALVVLAVATIFRGAALVSKNASTAATLGAAATLVWFAVSEDFQPRHLTQIDSREVNFRRNVDANRASHYHPRGDVRAVAEWLTQHANPAADLVISGPGVASIDFYYPGFDLVYVDPSDQRLGAWSCRRGTTERWSNLPLVYSMTELRARIAESPRSYMVVARGVRDALLADLRQLGPRVVWTNEYGGEEILQFDTPPQ